MWLFGGFIMHNEVLFPSIDKKRSWPMAAGGINQAGPCDISISVYLLEQITT